MLPNETTHEIWNRSNELKNAITVYLKKLENKHNSLIALIIQVLLVILKTTFQITDFKLSLGNFSLCNCCILLWKIVHLMYINSSSIVIGFMNHNSPKKSGFDFNIFAIDFVLTSVWVTFLQNQAIFIKTAINAVENRYKKSVPKKACYAWQIYKNNNKFRSISENFNFKATIFYYKYAQVR